MIIALIFVSFEPQAFAKFLERSEASVMVNDWPDSEQENSDLDDEYDAEIDTKSYLEEGSRNN